MTGHNVRTMRLFELVLHLFHPRRSNNHRPKILHPDLILGIFAVIMVAGIGMNQLPKYIKSLGNVLGYASSITIEETLAQTNAKRAEVGLSPLRINSNLSSAALAKGQDMFNQQYWSHKSPAGKQPWDFMKESGYSFSVAGENLARDFSTTQTMMEAWMRSPSHKANILHPRYSEIGLAVIDGKLEGVETTLVVQMFGRPVTNKAKISPDGEQTTTIDIAQTSTPSVLAQKSNLSAQLVLNEEPRPGVLASTLAFSGQLTNYRRYSPLEIVKSGVVSTIIFIGLVFIYDHLVIGKRRSWRQVGKTPAHLLLIAVALFFALLIKSGRLG